MARRPVPTLPHLLAELGATTVEGGGADHADEALAASVRLLEAAAREAATVGGWTADDPLRLAKGRVGWLARCPRRALAPTDGDLTDDLVAGLVVDAAAKLATLVPHRRPTVEAAVRYLEATGDTAVARHLADRADGGALQADVAGRVALLAGLWPELDAGWWPRVEEPVRMALAGGAVVVSGRLDLLLGGPPTPRPAVVVEVKGGRWHDSARADAHLYALLLARRDRRAPAAVVTVVADGTTQVEPVRPAVLATAADRVVHALEVAATIAAGEPAPAHPGPHCAHCSLRRGCPEAALAPTAGS
ncbi:MAG TPA: PD-(D/E)XK nuclease family protein [Acidimicrobiales bacterium]|nr:PD-(D/E)XK nuclease family protein [Acidimicrobiales bacterium]